GCGSDSAGSGAARHGQAPGVTVGGDTGCVSELTVDWDDNGSTHCLPLHGQVTLAVRMPSGDIYDGDFVVDGSSLQLLPTPGRSPWKIYGAMSTGTTVISLPPYSCLTGQTCMSGSPWTVTIVVR